jgi:hypothetical protein
MPGNNSSDQDDRNDGAPQPSTSPVNTTSAKQTRAGIFDNGFNAYRTNTDNDYRSLFSSGLIVLDANVLLNLYRYHPETRQSLLDVFDQLGDRLWVPNHAMAEFWANRESVLEESRDVTGTIEDLNRLGEQYLSRVRQWANRAGLRRPMTDKVTDIIKPAFGAIITTVKSMNIDKTNRIAVDTEKDSVINQLKPILDGRVGNPLSTERKRVVVNDEAQQRFADKRPPGYMDAKKRNANDAGDLLVWVETLEEAARLKADVLFITGDTKEDWWRQERGEAKGPHPQLVEEMWNVAGVRLFMLRPESLLQHASDLLKIEVSPESVQDAQRVTADISWERASEPVGVINVILAILHEVAREKATITYNELTRTLQDDFRVAIASPNALYRVLAEVSEREHDNGRGMISAVVVGQMTGRPPAPFFEMARRAPFNRTGDNHEIWLTEIQRIYKEHEQQQIS